jgi:hypothetical protein
MKFPGHLRLVGLEMSLATVIKVMTPVSASWKVGEERKKRKVGHILVLDGSQTQIIDRDYVDI